MIMSDSILAVIIVQVIGIFATVAAVKIDISWLKSGYSEIKKELGELRNAFINSKVPYNKTSN